MKRNSLPSSEMLSELLRRTSEAGQIGNGLESASTAGGFARAEFDLSTVGPTPIGQGKCYGLFIPRAGNPSRGKITVSFEGGGTLDLVPGSLVLLPFDRILATRHSESVQTGTLLLRLFRTPNAYYAETAADALQGTAPYLLGALASWSAIQGEGAGPPTRSLQFSANAVAFTPGLTLTGGTSGATGVLASQVFAAGVGATYLAAVTGTFQNGETVTDGAGGTGTASAADTALTGDQVPTSFLVTGWKKVTVLIDTQTASANATSFTLTPHFWDPDASIWADQALEDIMVPDSTTTGQRYRAITLPLTGLRGRMYLQISSLLASARTGLAFKVLGVE